MNYINIALPKGKLLEPSLKLFKSIGIDCREVESSTRKLLFTDEDNKIKFFLAKASDVPSYVEYGTCDIGIAGLDTILEENKKVKEVLDLGFGKCKMVVAGKINKDKEIASVATKYSRIASEFYKKNGINNMQIIKLSGSVELAAVGGLSDVIVDIVETGRSLKENELTIIETILELSARLIINQNLSKDKSVLIDNFIKKIKNN